MPTESSPPFYQVPGSATSRWVLLCEHATAALPAPWRWPDEDGWLLETHWAYDLGAAELTRELAQAMSAPAVLAGFSRLLADANRAPHDDTWMRLHCEGRPVRLNAGVGDEDRRLRLETCFWPYHAAVDAMLTDAGAASILSMHTFTPVWEGNPRPMEVGVLFDREDDIGRQLAVGLSDAGFLVAENAPYSGKDGLIWSARRAGDRHARRVLELEVRQDRAVDPGFRARFVDVLGGVLSRL